MTPMPSGSRRMVSSVTPGRMVGLMMPTTPRQLENGMPNTPKSFPLNGLVVGGEHSGRRGDFHPVPGRDEMPFASAGFRRMTQHGDTIDLPNARLGGALPRIDAKGLAIGGSVALVGWLALVPIAFLLWQSFLTPQTPPTPPRLTLENYRAAVARAQALPPLRHSVAVPAR